MVPRLFSAGLVVLSVLLPSIASAQFSLQELQQLQRDDAGAAYTYAQKHRAEQEGNPGFDFYFGIAAIDTGNVSQGVFALERVLAAQPNNHMARLELARGYFILEEYERAREEFETVLAQKPPSSVVTKIDRFLNAIRSKEGRYRTTGNGFIQVGVGNDSNINTAPGNASIGNNLVLTGDSVETEDAFSSLLANGSINTPMTANVALFGSASADVKVHADKDQFDNHALTARGGARLRTGQNHFQVDLQYQRFVFNDRDLRDLVALNGSWRRRTSARNQFSVFAQIAGLEYPDQPVRDSALYIIGGGYSQQFGGRYSPVLFASAYGGVENPDAAGTDAARVAERDLIGARVGAQVNSSRRSTLLLSVNLQHSDYGAPPLIGSTADRSDEYAGVEIDWTYLVNRTFRVSTELAYATNDSNDPVSEFDRTTVLLALRAEFN